MAAPKDDRSGIRQTIRALKAAGYTLDRVFNGGDEDEPVRTEAEAIAEIMAVDDAYLYVLRGREESYVRFVMGNEPFEVICDNTVNLEPVLGPLTARWQE